MYFVSQSAMVAGGLNQFGVGPVAEQSNLYVYDTVTEKTAFIATLGGADHQDWQREFRRPVEVAGGEGQFLLFASSTKGLIPGDSSGLTQLLEYDAESKELVRVTQGEDGYNENGNSVALGVEPGSIANATALLGDRQDFKSVGNQLNVGDNGQVVFVTRGALSPRATSAAQGCRNVYEFHWSHALSEGTVHLLSDGRDTQLFKSASACGPLFQAMDGDGANVLISTADPLVPGDVDGVQRDIYDVREGGGFPASSTPACVGEACMGAFSSPPGPAVPGSVGQAPEALVAPVVSPSGNLKAASHAKTKKAFRCPKGKQLSHNKCIKAKSKSKAKKASDDRSVK